MNSGHSRNSGPIAWPAASAAHGASSRRACAVIERQVGLHALPALTSRRNPRAAAGLGRWCAQARRLKKAGREMEGAVALQRGKDAVLLRQRPEAVLSCFSSGKHGDIFTFLMETEGLSFPEAVERLAERGRASPCRSSPRGGPERRRSSARASTTCMELAAAVLRGAAAGPRRGRGARLSRRSRRSTPRDAGRFRIGYAPAGPLRPARPSRRQGRRRVDMMVEAGLLVTGEDIPRPL